MLSSSLYRSSLFVCCALMVAVCSSASFAAERPFTGEVSGFGMVSGDPHATLDGAGEATHLGLCATSFGIYGRSVRQFFSYYLPTFPDAPFIVQRPARLLSADGSVLFGTIHYQSYDSGSLTATATLTITNGAGRFAGATGIIDVVIVFTEPSLSEFDCLMDGTLDY